jgi:CRISPR-associated protein Cas2
MAAGKSILHLLAYDIADPRRLVRVHRTVRNVGVPLQYSVFLVPGTAAEIDRLLVEIDDIIDPRQDDIRVYPLPQKPDVVHYGRQWLAPGSNLLGEGPLHQLLGAIASAPAGD